jgi:hypothetical protein
VCSVLRCPDLCLQCSVHTESLFLLRRHLGNWPRGPAVSKRSELLVANEKLKIVSAADGVRFTRVRSEIDFLLTFEIAPFYCERTVYTHTHHAPAQHLIICAPREYYCSFLKGKLIEYSITMAIKFNYQTT